MKIDQGILEGLGGACKGKQPNCGCRSMASCETRGLPVLGLKGFLKGLGYGGLFKGILKGFLKGFLKGIYRV